MQFFGTKKFYGLISTDMTWLDRIGLDLAGPDRTGLAGPDRAGLGWTGSDWNS